MKQTAERGGLWCVYYVSEVESFAIVMSIALKAIFCGQEETRTSGESEAL